jgi:hypothetical protein
MNAAVQALVDAAKSENAIAELTAGFGHFFGEALGKAPAGDADEPVAYRERHFPLPVTFWAFLMQVLNPGASCREAVRQVQLWWSERDSEKRISSKTGAYCRARARLPFAWLQELQRTLVSKLSDGIAAGQLWCGRRVKVIDGTMSSMPDTEANQEFWPQQKSQKPGCGFPLMRIVGLFCLSTGALLKTARGTLHEAELRLASRLWDCLEKGDVLLADRGFCSYALIARLLLRGVDSVMRFNQSRRLGATEGEWLGEGDRLVTWKRPRRCHAGLEAKSKDYDTLPETMTLRVIQWRIEVPGFRTQEVILVTTLLDPKAYPAKMLQELYLRRWGVEINLREIKILLGMDILRCKSPEMVEREVLLHQIAYNLVRCVMQQAAASHKVDLRRLSFKGTLDTMRIWAPALHASRNQPGECERLYTEMLRIIASDRLPDRPARSEPRAKKRRPKNYRLLTKPRRQMQVPSRSKRSKHVSA